MAEDIIYLNHKTHPIKFINSLYLPLCSSSIADHYVTLPRKPRRYHANRDSGVSSERESVSQRDEGTTLTCQTTEGTQLHTRLSAPSHTHTKSIVSEMSVCQRSLLRQIFPLLCK